jgi:hypothetical protein
MALLPTPVAKTISRSYSPYVKGGDPGWHEHAEHHDHHDLIERVDLSEHSNRINANTSPAFVGRADHDLDEVHRSLAEHDLGYSHSPRLPP